MPTFSFSKAVLSWYISRDFLEYAVRLTQNILASLIFMSANLIVAAPGFAQGTSVSFGALKHDSSLPVEVTSDQLAVDQASGQAVFTGNVLIGQGELRLSAARVEVIYAAQAGKIAKLMASGGVTITNAGEAAEAQRAEYNLEASQVILSGDVILTQAGSALSGDRMTIDLATGTGQIDGRVKTILQPGQQN